MTDHQQCVWSRKEEENEKLFSNICYNVTIMWEEILGGQVATIFRFNALAAVEGAVGKVDLELVTTFVLWPPKYLLAWKIISSTYDVICAIG